MGLAKTEKESNTLSGSVISVVWLFVFICTQLCTKFWKCEAKNYLEESLSLILCLIIQGKGSSGKSLILKFILLRMVI